MTELRAARHPALPEDAATAALAGRCAPWTFGVAALLRNLARRGVLGWAVNRAVTYVCDSSGWWRSAVCLSAPVRA
jgi:hypothetical protein